MLTWSDLAFWQSGEWQAASERLDELSKKGIIWCPGKKHLFSALHLCPYDTTRVCIVGQDPYPNPALACGLAFSVPKGTKEKDYPPTLKNFLKEYDNDLHYHRPDGGDLTPWASSGVLLWNASPSCEAFRSASHRWPEWEELTKEICQALDERGIVFVLLGKAAHALEQYLPRCDVYKFTHPSPLSATNRRGRNPSFLGSRLFSTVNGCLVKQGLDAINWRL